MNDIFISYDSDDRPIAQRFADALESRGWSVWWDREIPLGKAFDQVIEEELNAARCVIVLWSKQSVRSRWVKTEAAAADRECLLPVLIENVPIPFEFKRIQTAMLMNWQGNPADPEFNRLVQAIEQLLGQTNSARPVAPPKRRETKRSLTSRRGVRTSTVAIAVMLALIGGSFALLRSFKNNEQRSPTTPSPPPSSAMSSKTADSSSSSMPVASSTNPFAPPPGAFAIKIGDKIDDGVPGPGAGIIETPYGQDVYAFSAVPRQRVYFRKLRHSTGMEQINFKLTDPNGTEVFNTCLGCGEVGVRSLTKGGTYTLTVGDDKQRSTGTYQLQLVDVPPPSQFSIKVGDQIKDDVPGGGAGIIESPGAEDIYTFTAAPRQKVYFRSWEHSTGMSQIKWRLTDDDGMEVFDTCLGCGEPGVQTLTKGGTYTLTVGHQNNPATGTYRLQLYDVPPSKQFSIKIGDKVRPGAPAAGAGSIESPGMEDIYVFSAAPGQKAYFRILEHSQGMSQIIWRLVDDNGMQIFDTCLACGEPGVQTLSKGGTYTLTIGNTRNPATGNYAFEIGPR